MSGTWISAVAQAAIATSVQSCIALIQAPRCFVPGVSKAIAARPCACIRLVQMSREGGARMSCGGQVGMGCALFGQLIPVAHRVPFLEVRTRQPPTGDLLQTRTSDAVVDKPALCIPAKLITDYAAAIKTMHSGPVNVPTPFEPAHPKEILMEMIVASEDETGLTQARVSLVRGDLR